VAEAESGGGELLKNLKLLDKYKGTPEYDEYFHNEVLAYVGRY
jgi:hypothetical protein